MSFKFENSDYEIEMDNKKYFTSPRKLFIVFYIFILIGIIIVGINKIDYMHYSKNPEIPAIIKGHERANDKAEIIKTAIAKSNETASETNAIINQYVESINSSNTNISNKFISLASDLNQSVHALNSNVYWSNDIDIFKSILKSNINDTGFNAKVNFLKENEWIELHNYLNSIF